MCSYLRLEKKLNFAAIFLGDMLADVTADEAAVAGGGWGFMAGDDISLCSLLCIDY